MRNLRAYSFLILMPFLNVQGSNVYSLGHADIGPAFENNSFSLKLHADRFAVVNDTLLTADTAYAADVIIIEIADSGGLTAPIDIPEAGVMMGDTIWVLPQVRKDADDAGVPWLGIGAEEIIVSDWSGDFTFELIDVVGPSSDAVFSAWQSLAQGGLAFYFSTATGASTANDNKVIMPRGGHGHYSWGFNEPGYWEVTFKVTGQHDTFGSLDTTATFAFDVAPDRVPDVPEPSAVAFLFGLPAMLMARRHEHTL